MGDLPPPRIPTLEEIEAARDRIEETIVRTPLVRLEGTANPTVWLKLENLQPVNSFKLRGAMSALTALSKDELEEGVWTVSAGNAGQGVTYAAREAGIPATVLAVESAPETKLERMRALGAEIHTAPYEVCWQATEERTYPGIEGTFIHPFDDHEFIAGNATIGVEILDELPGTGVIGAAVGGGGLSSGIGSAVEAIHSDRGTGDTTVIGVEPETAAPAALSYDQGEPRAFPDRQATFVDGAGGQSLQPRMWERMRRVVNDVVVVSLDETRVAVRRLAEQSRVIAEGAGALPVAAAVNGQLGSEGPVVAVVSGGNIDLTTFQEVIDAAEPTR